MFEIRRAGANDAQIAFDIRRLAIRHPEVCLDATLNAVDFYRRCGYIGEGSAIYQSPSGLQLACVPMVKALR
ncbi:hypothetical protein LS633_27470 [Pseudomonas sp. NIBR-H-19]|nr:MULTISPECIES: hypothetical protein [Pseudomonas]UHC82082.1 hypothetical protein LS633_27470 [Pseudomonas sp. NIBR-H-19]